MASGLQKIAPMSRPVSQLRFALLLIKSLGCAAPVLTSDDSFSDDGKSDSVCPKPMLAPLDVAEHGRVIPIYLLASDSPSGATQIRATYYARALTAIQRWYANAMGPQYYHATFHVEPIIQVQSQYSRAQWDDFQRNGFPQRDGTYAAICGLTDAAHSELNGGILTAHGLPPVGTPGILYIIVVGGASGGACGLPGIVGVEEMELDRIRGRCPDAERDVCARSCSSPGGLAGIDPWCDHPDMATLDRACAAVGSFAHEIGHGFGLVHPPDRTAPDKDACAGKTIMDGNWANYGSAAGVSLCDPDRLELWRSVFFSPW
jgi:hypothetical protein